MEEFWDSVSTLFSNMSFGSNCHQEYSASAQKYCPSCQYKNKPKTPFCRMCGWTLPYAIESNHALLDDRITCVKLADKTNRWVSRTNYGKKGSSAMKIDDGNNNKSEGSDSTEITAPVFCDSERERAEPTSGVPKNV